MARKYGGIHKLRKGRSCGKGWTKVVIPAMPAHKATGRPATAAKRFCVRGKVSKKELNLTMFVISNLYRV